jgi:hypothetical protein
MMVIKEKDSKVDAAQAVDPMAAVVLVVAAVQEIANQTKKTGTLPQQEIVLLNSRK